MTATVHISPQLARYMATPEGQPFVKTFTRLIAEVIAHADEIVMWGTRIPTED
jgi:hypothetical protein